MNKKKKPEDEKSGKSSPKRSFGSDKYKEGDKLKSRKSRSLLKNKNEKTGEQFPRTRSKAAPKFFQPKDTDSNQKENKRDFTGEGSKRNFKKEPDQRGRRNYQENSERPKYLQPKDNDIKRDSGRKSTYKKHNTADRSSRAEANFSKSSDAEQPIKKKARFSENKLFDKNASGRYPDKTEKRENSRTSKYLKYPKKSKKSEDLSSKNAENSNPDEIRLNRYIANAGVCSRRDADVLIKAGEITVNGKVITEMGYKVKYGDDIRHNNRRLKREKSVYILVNKPKDFITTTDDPGNRKTIMNLVESAGTERIYPVGRLDRNTTGLIIMTNDGELADKLSHPSNNVKKLYQVDLDKPISNEDLIKIKEGVTLEDGIAEVDEIAVVSPDAKSLGLQIHSGKNRIVRRIFEHLGYDVIKLDRVMYAGLDKKDLPRGKWRFLSEKEVIRLKYLK